MIAEAVDAALLLWRALWLWIIAGALVATLTFLGTVAAVWAVCRMLRRAWGVVGPRTDSLPPLTAEQPLPAPESHRATGRTSQPRRSPEPQEIP